MAAGRRRRSGRARPRRSPPAHASDLRRHARAPRARSRSARDGGWRIGALAVEAIDTTGAGDAFVGVLAAALDRGLDAAGGAAAGRASPPGLACTRLGAQTSQPDAGRDRGAPGRPGPAAPLRLSAHAALAPSTKEVHRCAASSCRSPPWLALLAAPAGASAFCGFYVAKADSELFNQASKVVLVRHDGKTVITMVNDYQGALQEFALVVPVPSVLERGQIHVTENALVDHLDAYTAPRLVEYFDEDPCRVREETRATAMPASPQRAGERRRARGRPSRLSYTVGEYDIVILSAEQSGGLLSLAAAGGLPPAGRGRAAAGRLSRRPA